MSGEEPMSVEGLIKCPPKISKRMMRVCLQVALGHEDVIKRIEDLASVLDNAHIHCVKILPLASFPPSTLVGLFSTKQLWSSTWQGVVRNLFGCVLPENTAAEISHFISMFKTNPLTQVFVRDLSGEPAVAPPARILMKRTERAEDFPEASAVSVEAGSAAIMEQPPQKKSAAEREESGAGVGKQIYCDPVFLGKVDDFPAIIIQKVCLFLNMGFTALPPEPKPRPATVPLTINRLMGLKQEQNKIPFPINEIQDLVPPVVKESMSKFRISLSGIQSNHAKDLQAINLFMRRGLLKYYPFPILTQLEYGCKDLSKPGSSVIELHRRIMRLEQGIARMSDYFYRVALRIRVPECIPKNLLNMILLVLQKGSGKYGAGSDFFKCNDFSKTELVTKLGQFSHKNLGEFEPAVELVDWLSLHRKECLTHESLAFTGHALAIVPACLSIALNAEKLAKLNDPSMAMEVCGDFNAVSSALDALCRCEVLPLVKYGSELTKYYQIVHEACVKLHANVLTSTSIKQPMPVNIKLTNTGEDKNGNVYVHDRFSHVVEEGHLVDFNSKTPYILPFPQVGADFVMPTLDERKAAVKVYKDLRKDLVDKFMALHCKDKAVPKTLQLQDSADKFIVKLFNEDSHMQDRTRDLPVTASMPDAIMNYAMPFP